MRSWSALVNVKFYKQWRQTYKYIMTCMKTWADWESNISPTPISMISLFTAASHIYTALITAYASDVSLKKWSRLANNLQFQESTSLP